MTCRFHDLPLLPKVFEVWGSVRGSTGFGDIIDWQHLANFRITDADARVALDPNASLQHLQDDAPLYLPYDWYFQERIGVKTILMSEFDVSTERTNVR